MPEDREILRDIFYAGLSAVDPYSATLGHLDGIERAFMQGRFRGLRVLGFGKAACPMARAVEERLGGLIEAGIVITKYGHAAATEKPDHFRIFEAGHPIPDRNSTSATKEALGVVKGADAETFFLCLISGGGSALLVLPLDGITLEDCRSATELLLRKGATIKELNVIRKHLSQVKGGRLAKFVYPATTVSLILSDVIGDKLDIIASGPTAPDESTYVAALQVLEKYALVDLVPAPVREVFHRGTRGQLEDTPKKGDHIFDHVENRVIASNRIALQAAEAKARASGFRTRILSSELEGEARAAAAWLFSETEKVTEPGTTCLIAGGETTVTVKGTGVGGRNTELALAFALRASGREDVVLLSAGTDGTDGPTDAAGAFADGGTVQRGAALRMDARSYIDNNDSYTYFNGIRDLFITGPTGTNVMDMQFILVTRDKRKPVKAGG